MSISPDLFFITSQGNYFLAGSRNPPLLSLYYYNTITTSHSYSLSLQLNNLPYFPTTVNGASFVKDDKSYFYFCLNFGSVSTASYFHIYFECTVPFCLNCSFFDYCIICQSGFVLNGSTCVCPSGKSLVNNICINCTVPLC
jgi:hypothetical protein